MMQITNNILVQCDKCGRKYSFSPEELDYDCYTNDAPMGIETVHRFIGEETCICGNELYVNVTASEYPSGGYNFHSHDSKGCKITNEPRVIVELLPESVISAFDEILGNPEAAYQMETWEFEELVAEVFRRRGYETEVTQRTRDGGRDVIANFDAGGISYSAYIECKRFSQNNPVDVGVVRELYGVMERDRKNKGIVVTTSYFSPDAIREAKRYGERIQLIDYRKLQDMMRKC